MAYILYQFGAVPLSRYDSSDDANAGQVAPGYIETIGGTYDTLGSEHAPRKATTLSKRCLLITDTAAEMRTQYTALTALNGQKQILWRHWDTGETEWAWARLIGITATRAPRYTLTQEVALKFLLLSTMWNGVYHGDGTWALDDGTLLDLGYALDDPGEAIPLSVGANTLTVTNNGNARCTNPVLMIQAAAAAITSLTIACGTSELIYSSTLAAGEVLAIDCGGRSVLNNGSSDYAGLGLTANHKNDDWIRLEPGANTVTITMVGASPDSQAWFEFHDAWE